jgi:hypothetical protein
VKVVFESVIFILTLVRVSVPVLSPCLRSFSHYGQDEMIHDDAYLELAKCCVRACHVLKTATEGRSGDSLSGPSKKKIGDLGGYVDQANSSTDDNEGRQNRTPHRVRGERTPELRPRFTGASPWAHHERLVAWRAEIVEILRFFGVRGCHSMVPTVPKPP